MEALIAFGAVSAFFALAAWVSDYVWPWLMRDTDQAETPAQVVTHD